MKLNELISKRYNCKFPQYLTVPAIHYYREHSRGTRCLFFLEEILRTKDSELHPDVISYMEDVAPEGYPELFEAYLFAAYEEVKENPKKPRGIVIVLGEEQ